MKSRNYYSSLRVLLSICLLLCIRVASAQDDLIILKDKWLEYSDAQNSLYHYLSSRAYVLLEKRNKEVAGIKDLAGWQERQKYIRETLLKLVGPFPEKSPLNAKIVRTIHKEDYRVEHIIFESQPKFYVTSSLFIPGSLIKNQKAPAIIYCSGHSEDGYRNTVYQYVILNLVKKGFIVFAFDPVGQGERLEYFDPKTNKSTAGGPTSEHSYPGAQAFISGSCQARYMIWDGIRAVDYLLTRKEVDPARIGITGRSGGGTQSAYIAAFDDRIYAAAPENYITNFTRLLQTIGPQDAEQNLPGQILNGIDHPDYLIVRAPKPALMITTTRDMFSIQGAGETEAEVSRIYEAYGVKENFSRVEDDTVHASSRKNREAMYAFFIKYLKNPGDPSDQVVSLLTPGEMKVTSSGQVSASFSSETVFSLNSLQTAGNTSGLSDRKKDITEQIAGIKEAAVRLSGYEAPVIMSKPVFCGRIRKSGYVIEKYFIKMDGGYVIPYLLYRPYKISGKAIICLYPQGKTEEASPGGEMEWFVKQGIIVLSPDLSGIGEVGPGILRGDVVIEGISHNTWYASLLIGSSITGIRAGEVIRLVKILKGEHGINEICCLARNELAPVALHAAVFDPSIKRIGLVNPLISYKNIVMNRYYKSSFIPAAVAGSLKEYDLPDLMESAAPAKLLLAGPVDGNGNYLSGGAVSDAILYVKQSYQSVNLPDNLIISAGDVSGILKSLYLEWMK